MKAALLPVLLFPLSALAQDNTNATPIPKDWLVKYKLDADDPQVSQKDADGDGFTNEDEWHGQTDPIQKDSHPPYHTKLFLKEEIRIPFRLKFQTYKGDRKKLESLRFQISTFDLKQPPRFYKIGDPIKGTQFKIIKFEFETVADRRSDEMFDVSKITIRNADATIDGVLTLRQLTDFPTRVARFAYSLSGNANSGDVTPFEFTVVQFEEFNLLPDATSHYKLIDFHDSKAIIKTPEGEEYTVPTLPR